MGNPQRDQHENEHAINLNVPGILRLLSEHLYADPRVALRELIQNAHDSCMRRLAEDSLLPKDYVPRIDIHIDPAKHTLELADNGSGLTESEIHDYLATIGKGYTGELRERLQFGDIEHAQSLIGQFGLGLLSAFLVASRLEITTRSYLPVESGWRWESRGDRIYTLDEAHQRRVGTTFKLYLKLEGEFLLNEGIVTEIVRTYADFLQVPIYVNGSDTPANVMNAPWHKSAKLELYEQFVMERFGSRRPLTVLPLHNHEEVITLPDGTQDSVVIPLDGVLFVPADSTLSIQEFGDLTVYIRRMFITEVEHELLPRWARFVRGVVETPALTPTASREHVRRDESFYDVRQALGEQLVAHFHTLAADSPEEWERIVVAHNDLIKGWALESPGFFEEVADLVLFETSSGRMNLPDILEATEGTLHYFTGERATMQERLLYEALDIVAIDASRFAEEAFLRHYTKIRPEVVLKKLDHNTDLFFQSVEDVTPWLPLVRYYRDQGISVELVTFKPASVPALMAYPPDSDAIADARKLLNQGEMEHEVGGLFEEYLRLQGVRSETEGGTLQINAACSLMHQLRAGLAQNPEMVTAALEIIYHNARIFTGRPGSGDESRRSFDMITYSLETLVSKLDPQTDDNDENAEA